MACGPACCTYCQARYDIRDVVIAAVDRCYAHAGEKWETEPEEPGSVAAGGQDGDHGAGHVCAGEGGAVDAAEMFDEVDGGGECAAFQWRGIEEARAK